jgi:hypothetical protein
MAGMVMENANWEPAGHCDELHQDYLHELRDESRRTVGNPKGRRQDAAGPVTPLRRQKTPTKSSKKEGNERAKALVSHLSS